MNRLNEVFNMLESSGVSFPDVPDYISDNLAYELRPYQYRALSRFYHYYSENYRPQNKGVPVEKSRHLLWQMATGSGKTMIMAALMLELYCRGYRNFLFFVNSKNVLVKSESNFTDNTHEKYQFAKRIEIDGKNVRINYVNNFDSIDRNAINIVLMTIQKLHEDITNIKENSIAIEALKDIKLIMLADEAHHLNSMTSKGEETVETSWENTVQDILTANSENLLLEFTATIDWGNPEIAAKYNNKIIYNYDLKAYRMDGYSKDVFTFAVDNDTENRMLQAIIISHYRKRIAFDYGIFLKPVILFRSKSIKDSCSDFANFNNLINSLSCSKIATLFDRIPTGTAEENIWVKAVGYFQHDADGLVSELAQDFQEGFNIIINSEQIENNVQAKLNTLEKHDNPTRAIFAVDMLKEGWDVLNLFDIVRLYETRDGKWKNRGRDYVPGKTTISEQQLIGRGARYFPFVYQAYDKYKRKFDDNETEPLRIIEQMHYHCKNDPLYITEIRKVLIDSGIMTDDDIVEYTLKMKDMFSNGAFQQMSIYENTSIQKRNLITKDIEVVEKSIEGINIQLLPCFESATTDDYITVHLNTGETKEEAVFNG